MRIKEIITLTKSDIDVTVSGWIRNKRVGKNVAFISLNDGSTINNLQIVIEGGGGF